jgi:hypothetical protein
MHPLRPLHSRAIRVLVATAVVALAGLALPLRGAEAAPFGPNSVWTAPLARSAPLASRTSAMVRELARQTTLSGGAWIDTSQWSSPFYTVPAGQPRVRVALDDYSPALQADFESVPLPDDALPARGTDAHLALHQPGTDTYWEFWGLARRSDGWHARWGGKIAHVSTSPGYFPYPFGSTATGLPLAGGLIRLDELRAGRIDHALAVNIPEPEANTFAWPASRTDGTATGPAAIPEGTRFRLDPNLDIDALGLPRVTTVMARAAQQYGIVVTDRGGSVAFKAEDPAQFGSNPYPALFGGRAPDELLSRFPWQRLQVVRATSDVFGPSDPGAPPAGPHPRPRVMPRATPARPPFVVRALGDGFSAGGFPSLTASGLHAARIAVGAPVDFANLSLSRSTPAEWAGGRGTSRRRAELGRRLHRLEADHPSLVTVGLGADLLRSHPACARTRRCAARLVSANRVRSNTRRLLTRLTAHTRADVLLVLIPLPRGARAAGARQVNAALRRAAAGLSKRVVVVSPPRSAGQRAIASLALRRYARALAARR